MAACTQVIGGIQIVKQGPANVIQTNQLHLCIAKLPSNLLFREKILQQNYPNGDLTFCYAPPQLSQQL